MLEPKDIALLVVDDEEALREAIAFDFKKKGFMVWEARCGREAFEIVKSQKIDLVLTDVRMPDGDGIELLDKIKERNPVLPVVIFITGFSDLSLEEAYHKGAEVVFSKPFDRKTLLETVANLTISRDELWRSRKSVRVDIKLNSDLVPKIDLRFSELNAAIAGKLLNIGRGGISVSFENFSPKLNMKVDFCIQFNQGVLRKIEGRGIVRWLSPHKSDTEKIGCGIEFESFDEQSRIQVVELINTLKTRPFIPRG